MENLQEDLAVVKEVNGNEVTIEIMKEGSCDSCAMHGVCAGHDKTFTHTIKTDLKLKKDDVVRFNIAAPVRIFSSFIIFVFPILMMILFYFIAHSVIKTTEGTAILITFIGFILSGIIVYFIDKKFGKKVNFTIEKKG